MEVDYSVSGSARILNDSDLDVDHLRVQLDAITAKFDRPYLERRMTSINPDPIVELQITMEEISDREREVLAAAGIAKILLDKNRQLVTLAQIIT
jgi:hypothetical protein